jgi:nucleotide-binding universal stress UspA family protein
MLLLAVDGSESSAKATSVAFEIAELTNSKVLIMHVVPTPTVKQFALKTDTDPELALAKFEKKGKILLAGYEDASQDYDVEVETVLEHGLPAERIITVADEREVDMIILGTKETSKRAGAGSTTERVVIGSNRSVIVAK